VPTVYTTMLHINKSAFSSKFISVLLKLVTVNSDHSPVSLSPMVFVTKARCVFCKVWKYLYLLTYLLTFFLSFFHSFFLSFFLSFLLTHSLTPYRTVLLEKLTGLQPVKNFPPFYGTRRFITAFTSARHLSLSWPARSTSWRSILILSSHLRLGLLSCLCENLYS
jgi:hypothetical protein